VKRGCERIECFLFYSENETEGLCLDQFLISTLI